MRKPYFFGFILSFISGVAFENIFYFGFSLAILFAILPAILLLVTKTDKQRKTSFLVSLVLIGLSLGILRVDILFMKQNKNALDAYISRVVKVNGLVEEEPDPRETYTKIVLEARSILDGSVKNVLKEPVRILVHVPEYPVLRLGTEIVVTGKISPAKDFVTGDGQTFDYRTYLAKDNIFYQISFPSISVVAEGKGNFLFAKLFILKDALMKNITRLIPEPEAALGGGILLGVKQSLGEDLLSKFRVAGVAHIIVLSGYNISVVANAFSRVAIFLPFTLRLLGSSFAVILFAMMVGGGATVMRATIMVLAVIFARAIGRESDALRVLVFAGGLMVALNPLILLYDVSFQLSFLATLSLVTLSPILEKYFVKIPNDTVREILVTTVATQIFVFPILLYHMGTFSALGIISNLFILPTIPLAMFLVALVSVFGLIPIFGYAFAFVTYIILAYIIFIVELFSRIPFASVSGITFPLWALVVSYVVLGIYIIKKFPYEIDKKIN
ncbi:MAG: ComEC/Rec2 family competence protein [Candidatus Pacebacteria bacterium]|nr:ComEC/Rec2 family competence protein [Candidatus Paceibacterota bacterium]